MALRYTLLRELETVLGWVIFEHLARGYIDNQARPEENIYPIDRLNRLIEVLSLRVVFVLGRNHIVFASRQVKPTHYVTL